MLWKELILLLSVEGQPTKAGLTDMYGRIRSVFDTIFTLPFPQKTPADHWWSVNHRLINTALEGRMIRCYIQRNGGSLI
jgi:hypothetical protein